MRHSQIFTKLCRCRFSRNYALKVLIKSFLLHHTWSSIIIPFAPQFLRYYPFPLSLILTLVMMLSLSVNVFAAEPLTDDPNMIEWKYTVFANESLQKVVEEGVIPNAYARYTWRGITLKNGEVAILTPSNNSMGLYCNSGRYITINYTLSRSAFHRSRVRAYVAGPSSEFVREITASGLRSGFTTQATDYYYGMVTNLSSDAFTIKSFSITF